MPSCFVLICVGENPNITILEAGSTFTVTYHLAYSHRVSTCTRTDATIRMLQLYPNIQFERYTIKTNWMYLVLVQQLNHLVTAVCSHALQSQTTSVRVNTLMAVEKLNPMIGRYSINYCTTKQMSQLKFN